MIENQILSRAYAQTAQPLMMLHQRPARRPRSLGITARVRAALRALARPAPKVEEKCRC